MVERLARFVVARSWDDLSDAARGELKIRALDALGCALGSLDAPPVAAIRAQVEEFGGRPLCTLIGGGATAPDRAALCNGALVRYLDFNDSYFAPGETCHPSDNLAPVLAAAEYAHASGRELLTALAVAYQVQCRLSDEAPVRARGFDHTTQGAYAAAAGAAKALRLGEAETANAVAIAVTALNALRVTRTGTLSQWKGLAYPFTSFGTVEAAFLAARGVTGPSEVFEGNKGFMETIVGRFKIDWEQEDLERVRRTFLKRYNAEIHSQSALEALLELRDAHGVHPAGVERIELETFQVAYDIIGGGEEGGKKEITNEGAGRPLPALPACGRAPGRAGHARAVCTRADRPRGRAGAAAAGGRAGRGRSDSPFSGRARLPAAPSPRRRRDAHRREIRLRGLPDAPDGLGASAREVRAARRRAGRAGARGRARRGGRRP
jgi:2-methylcitrate dehydratase